MPGKMTSIGPARTQDAIAGRQLARAPARARCPQPPAASLPLPFSGLLSQTSHVYPPPAQLLRDSPVGRCLSLSARAPEDPRCPEGPGSQRPSIPTVRHAPVSEPPPPCRRTSLSLPDRWVRPWFPPQHHREGGKAHDL